MTTELATKAQEAGLAVKSAAGVAEGIEGMDDHDLKIGSIVLVQPLSKALVKNGIAPGKFANTVTEKEVVDTTFIPAYMTKQFIAQKWETAEKATYLFTVSNENDPRLNGLRRRQDGDLKAEVIPVIRVIAIMEGQPVSIAFKKVSGYPAGQKLYTYAQDAARSSGLPLWGQKYRLVSKDAKNKRGIEYTAIDVEIVGATTDEEKAFAVSLNRGFKSAPEPIVDSAEDTTPF
jgi:hypothetical protein